jgi:EAL domain-containing protein (putative c-di-GMP-specific phosphodiesterase class I)
VKRFELEPAITENELVLHSQPMVEVPSRELTAAEALVRWRHPERGLVSPLEFIPEVEATGLSRRLTFWVLREAPDPPIPILELMRAKGIRVTLDDASDEDAHMVEKLPMDFVKVSRELVTRMGRDHRALEYVRAVVSAARGRGIQATAVGVEDEETWDRLAGLGFCGAQGYLFAAAMPPAQLSEWRAARV